MFIIVPLACRNHVHRRPGQFLYECVRPQLDAPHRQELPRLLILARDGHHGADPRLVHRHGDCRDLQGGARVHPQRSTVLLGHDDDIAIASRGST